MTRLRTGPITVPGWVNGLVQDVEPGTLPLGAISEGENLLPTQAGQMRTRGGSRIVATLTDGNLGAEIDHVCALHPFTNVGALAIGWSDPEDKHYAWRLTSDMDFSTGSEGTSRHDITATATGWNTSDAPARPVMAEVWEKIFVADATATIGDRASFFSVDSAGSLTEPTFQFGAGAAAELYPFCLEEYNGVLFVAGYGTEDAGDLDRPEYLRHSFLGKSPDASDGFDTDAWIILGAKGQRITALRKGRGLLLAAKENEIYRITGFGRAYAGWQYQVEMVNNTKGLGVSNPLAFTFAEGFWYGVGPQGPIRTDGYTVESLVGPRQRGWRGIDNPGEAFVTYHPERRLVLFGLHETEVPSGRSDTYPFVLWAWDVTRGVWQPDWRMGADFFFAAPITTTTAQSASAAPTGGTTSSEGLAGYTASWTNGDSSAETEFWEKEGSGGTWTLVTVIAAGTATYNRTGRDNHTQYYWRVRHTKGGVKTGWNDEDGISAQTLIKTPGLSASQVDSDSQIQLDITQEADGTDIIVERQEDGGGYVVWNTYLAQASGSFTVYDNTSVCDSVYDYKARARDTSWPTTHSAYGANPTIDLTTGCSEA